MRGGAIRQNLRLLAIVGITAILSGISSTSAQELARNITLDHQMNPNPMMINGMSGGSLEAIAVVKTKETSTGPCNGLVNREPNHILILKTFFEFLKIEVESSIDTTILVQGPGGVWCNDDYNDFNPAIEGQWQKGKYKLWIGSYEETSNSYQIKITGKNP